MDVGAGEAAVVEFPDRRIFVVDGGGILGEDFDVGRAVVARFLWSQRIRRIDGAVMTAPVLHHYGGLDSLVALFQPKEFWSNRRSASSNRFDDLQDSLGAYGVQKVWVSNQTRCRAVAGVIFCARAVGQDETVALELFYGKVWMLLLPDGDTKWNAASQARPIRSQPTVLKVPRHGKWDLEQFSPKVVVLSARGSLKAAGPNDGRVPVFATAQDGSVSVETDGTRVNVRGHTGRRLELSAVRP